jgi:RNase P subunit RPR2
MSSRRVVKLPYTEKHMACPHCRAPLVIGTVMDTILLARRICPKCHKEFLIENDVPRKPADGLKKPSGSVRTTKSKKSAKTR